MSGEIGGTLPKTVGRLPLITLLVAAQSKPAERSIPCQEFSQQFHFRWKPTSAIGLPVLPQRRFHRTGSPHLSALRDGVVRSEDPSIETR